MKNNTIAETIVALCLLLSSALLLNPFGFWMPNMMLAAALGLILALFGVFASFVLREKSFDERDALHKALAGRNAFLAGSLVLLAGIAAESFRHAVDPWLVLGFVAMVLAKLLSRRWADRNQ